MLHINGNNIQVDADRYAEVNEKSFVEMGKGLFLYFLHELKMPETHIKQFNCFYLREDEEFSKKAVVLSTASGSGMKSATKDIQ